MQIVEQFFRGLSAAWPDSTTPPLRVIGSTALLLRTSHRRATKDSDILETSELETSTREKLLALAGPGTPLATKWGIYLETVPNGVPFLPLEPRWHPLELSGAPPSLRFEVLDVVDVAVSKMKRFHANDRDDVRAVVELGLVPHADFVARFRSAVDVFSGDARAEDLPRYVRNFHEVERDMFGVPPTEIDLPTWI